MRRVYDASGDNRPSAVDMIDVIDIISIIDIFLFCNFFVGTFYYDFELIFLTICYLFDIILKSFWYYFATMLGAEEALRVFFRAWGALAGARWGQGPKREPKGSQKESKREPKRSQNEAKMEPKTL